MKLLAIMSHYLMMNARTAAPTALSVHHHSRKDSSVLGCFGAGRHTSTQINAVSNERPGQTGGPALRADAFQEGRRGVEMGLRSGRGKRSGTA